MKSIKAEVWSGGRVTSLDAMRGLAAVFVVLYHSVQQARDTVPSNLLKWPVLFLHSAISFGYTGVFLFFVISGFCIHLQWAKARAAGEDYEVLFGAFWKRRIRRLYPPYLIALSLYVILTVLYNGITKPSAWLYDVVMHLFMVHNLDPKTTYSINGAFWTLAIEEQLYLAYFLLLFMRKRWGWGLTLSVCAASRVGWFFLSHVIWVSFGIGVPVPEAAASHWFTWALGAVSVEAAFGLIKLPRWCRNLWVACGALLLAGAISQVFPVTDKDGFIHRFCWLALHPAWGLGFFIIVNRAFEIEKKWRAAGLIPRMVALCGALGIFSYSLYLTHELVILESWRMDTAELPRLLNAFLITATAVAFAWIFFQFCEQPFMNRSSKIKLATSEAQGPESLFQDKQKPEPVFARNMAQLAEE